MEDNKLVPIQLENNAVSMLNSEDLQHVNEPVVKVEKSLTELFQSLCNLFESEKPLEDALQESLIQSLDEMTPSEKLTFYQLMKEQQNDRIGRTLGPSFGMITEELRAKIAAENKNQMAAQQAARSGTNTQINIGIPSGAAGAPPNVLKGFDSMMKLGMLLDPLGSEDQPSPSTEDQS